MLVRARSIVDDSLYRTPEASKGNFETRSIGSARVAEVLLGRRWLSSQAELRGGSGRIDLKKARRSFPV
jgi:hypothetical protein